MRLLRYWVVACGVASVLYALGVGASGPAENLVIVTFDGLRWQELFGGADARLMTPEAKTHGDAAYLREKYGADTAEARREKLLPFFWNEIAVQGQVYGHAESNSPSVVTNGLNFSYPGYSEMMTGVVDPRVDSNAKKNNETVNVLEWLNGQPGFVDSVAAFTSWDVFPFILNAERSKVPVNSGWVDLTVSPDADRLVTLNEASREIPHYWDSVRFDYFTFHGALEYVKARSPRVLYVSFGETDDWAHDNRYDMYLESAHRTDDYIRRLWEMLQSLPAYAGKTALLLTTDHGRGDTVADWTGHGSEVLGCERIWIALYGAGVEARGLVADTPTTQAQVAATGAALLGLDFMDFASAAAAPIRP